MALNLDALKNISSVHNNTDTPQQDVVPTPLSVQISQPTVSGVKMKMMPSDMVDKTANAGPKISLMKMKQSVTEEIMPKYPETPLEIEMNPVSEIIPESTPDVIEEESVAVESIVVVPEEQKEILPDPGDVVGETVSEVIVDKNDNKPESQSIIIGTPIQEAEQTKEIVASEPKEFFPNIQISHAINLHEDFLDLGSVINLDDPGEQSILTSPVIEKNTVKDVIASNTEDSTTEVAIHLEVDESIQDVATTTDVSSSMDMSTEYVAEVKTELSESRRAGFRFFMKHKTKILTGVGIIFSLSFIAMFSGSFLGIDMQNTGKINIHEGTKIPKDLPTNTENKLPPVIEVEMNTPPSIVEPMGYEMGRDYSVTKNNKKNIRLKGAKETIMDVDTGTKMPTP